MINASVGFAPSLPGTGSSTQVDVAMAQVKGLAGQGTR